MIGRRKAVMMFAMAAVAPLLLSQPALAAAELTWDNLIPPAPPLKNVYASMTPDEQEAMYTLDFWYSFPIGDVSDELRQQRNDARKDVDQLRAKLAAKGVNMEEKYLEYRDWQEEVVRRGAMTEAKYAGQDVSLTGYLLPLDFDAQGSREFLLVPFVGACIHVPPPPPNQVVLVETIEPTVIKELFMAATITGRMKIEASTKDLSLMDGSNNVDSSYKIENANVAAPVDPECPICPKMPGLSK